MKVLHIGKFFPPYRGGIETFLCDLVEELSKTITTDVLCFNSINKTIRERTPNYDITRVSVAANICSAQISPIMPFWIKKLSKNYDIIHMHLPNPTANLAYFLANPKSKLILHWHSDIIRQKKLLKLYDPLQKWLLKRADMIIATSDNYVERSSYLRWARYVKKCETVPLGMDPSRLESRPEKITEIKHKYGSGPIILTVGRLIYYKGLEYLLKAMKSIDASLIIAGKGPMSDTIRNTIHNMSLEKKVFMTGLVPEEDLGSYYAASDIFCLPSVEKSEAYGMVQVEAMGFKKPIISTDIAGSGVSWVNKDGITGIVVPVNDPQALASAINRIICNPAEARVMGENGYKRFKKVFDIRNVSKRLISIYNNILKYIK